LKVSRYQGHRKRWKVVDLFVGKPKNDFCIVGLS